MKTEFRKAVQPEETRRLSAFDRRVFTSDYFTPSDWKHYEVWWMVVDERKIGCCAFQKHADFPDDDSAEAKRQGSLYISSTGILPEFRRIGFGQLFKAWQIAYATRHGFTRIVTNVRKGNKAIIALNKKFGFRAIRTVPRYYCDPPDSTVVMELALER